MEARSIFGHRARMMLILYACFFAKHSVCISVVCKNMKDFSGLSPGCFRVKYHQCKACLLDIDYKSIISLLITFTL